MAGAGIVVDASSTREDRLCPFPLRGKTLRQYSEETVVQYDMYTLYIHVCTTVLLPQN